MADSKCEAIEKAMADAGPTPLEKEGPSAPPTDGATTTTVTPPPVQSMRFLRTFGGNEAQPKVLESTTASAVPGQVETSSAEPDVKPQQVSNVQCQGQGPPPLKAPVPEPPADKDLQWQRHQQHLAYLKSLGSEAYRVAVGDPQGSNPASPAAKESEVEDTTCTSTERGPELLQCLSVDVKHLFDNSDDFSRETSMVEKHLDEAMSVVAAPQETEKQMPSPRPLTTPGRGVRDVMKTPPTSVENWSQAEDREIWDKLKAQLQSLEDSVGELTRKTMPKPRRTLGELTQSHPSWPKDAGMTGFFAPGLPRASFPFPMAPIRRVSRDTVSEQSSSDVSSSNPKGHSSRASQSQQHAEQGSMEPEAMQRDARCMQLSCRSRSSNSLGSVPQLPTPCSAKIMAPEVIGLGNAPYTPSVGARTPAMSPGRSVVYRQISSPVALLTPRIAGEGRAVTPVAGYPQ